MNRKILETETGFFPASSGTRLTQFLTTFSAILAAFQTKAGFHPGQLVRWRGSQGSFLGATSPSITAAHSLSFPPSDMAFTLRPNTVSLGFFLEVRCGGLFSLSILHAGLSRLIGAEGNPGRSLKPAQARGQKLLPGPRFARWSVEGGSCGDRSSWKTRRPMLGAL